MAKEKTDFKWDSEELLDLTETEKTKTETKLCKLTGKSYVTITRYVKSAKAPDGWKRIKNNTIELELFKRTYDIVSQWELVSSFADSDVKITEKPSTKLTARHQAKGSAPAVLRGSKVSIREKLERNENFGSLSNAMQDKIVQDAVALHETYGMVSVGISKSSFLALYGKGQLEAEKEIKNTKGFSRAKITYIP